jgi:8-oxo-dGTP pyrophosphatase MutT (NUDIX family)
MNTKDYAAWPLLDRLGAITTGEKGIVCGAAGKFAIGCVLLLHRDAEFVFIRKAPKPDYEFSGLWALPGGVVRTSSEPSADIEPEALSALAAASLRARASAECGWDGREEELSLDLSVQPRMTSYGASGARRHALVYAFAANAAPGFAPIASDRSVSEARWMDPNDLIGQLAPANCLIVFSRIRDRLLPNERAQWIPHVEAAFASSSAWAAEVGWRDHDLLRID